MATATTQADSPEADRSEAARSPCNEGLATWTVSRLMGALLNSMLLTFSASLLAQDETIEPAEMPLARSIPGITAEDQFPNGCVDCHINYTDMGLDTRFSTLMMRWSEAVEPAIVEVAQAVAGSGVALTGVHPLVDATLTDIPAACFGCHERGVNNVVPLASLLHRIHLGGGNGEIFLRQFQGECTHCHKFDAVTGRWRVPSGREK